MKTKITNHRADAIQSGASTHARGFTLIELLVAMAVFVIVAGTAFSLFGKHEAYAIHQESLSGVNIGLRNAMAQMQIDLSSAGQNLFYGAPGVTTPFSLGVIVNNNVPAIQGGAGAACAPNTNTWAYPVPSACFDGFMIINAKPCAITGGQSPVLALTGAVNNINTLTSTSVTDISVGANMTNDASCYQTGDEVLIVEQNTQADPTCTGTVESAYCMTVVSLTSNAVYVPATSSITLTFHAPGANGAPSGCPGTSCNDPLGIVYPAYAGGGTSNYQNLLTANFALGTYVVDLGTGSNDVSYTVQLNPSDATDPQLVRCNTQLALCTAAAGQVVADQVIGFKVGAALWDSADKEDIASYFYNAAGYCNGSIPYSAPTNCSATPPLANDVYDYSLIRSMRISMIARTKPQSDQTLYNFKNGFDAGPYLVQQASVAVDLRNMSNNDFGN